MKSETRGLLEKSQENVVAINVLIAEGIYAVAIGRAYYAMFYCAEAALFEQGFEFSSHGATHSAFGRELIKTGRLPHYLHKYLLDAFRRRQEADYELRPNLTAEDAKLLLSQAVEFLAVTTAFLE